MKECKKVAPLDARVNRSLSTNSMISLSPSELNHAIMEMLNMSQGAIRCDAVFRGKLIGSVYRSHNLVLMTYQRVCNNSNTTDATSGTGIDYPVGAQGSPRLL